MHHDFRNRDDDPPFWVMALVEAVPVLCTVLVIALLVVVL